MMEGQRLHFMTDPKLLSEREMHFPRMTVNHLLDRAADPERFRCADEDPPVAHLGVLPLRVRFPLRPRRRDLVRTFS